MKKIIMTLALLLVIVSTCAGLSSCGDDAATSTQGISTQESGTFEEIPWDS